MSQKAWLGELFPRYVQWRQSEHGRTIYRIIGRISNDQHQLGRQHWSMFAAISVARWEYEVATRDFEGLKVSNTWEPYLARELTYSGKVPVGFFELVGGTPANIVEWCKRPEDERLGDPPVMPAFEDVKVEVPAAPTAQILGLGSHPIPCPVPMCGNGELVNLRPTIDARFVQGQCWKHGTQTVRIAVAT